MSYTVVSAKIDPQTKKEAMATAESLGVPLSIVIKAFLKQFIRTKEFTFSLAYSVHRVVKYQMNISNKPLRKHEKIGKKEKVLLFLPILKMI